MNTVIIITAIGFLVGFAWGFKKPANYCHLGREGAKKLSNRVGSGLINAAVLGGLSWVAASLLF